jgi:hypothetical protein
MYQQQTNIIVFFTYVIDFANQVKNKSWFGAQKAFRALLPDWTIQTIAVDSMLDFVQDLIGQLVSFILCDY